ncbi:MotE family protein [Gracilibacillus xinjiangensis]|uniref:MotE family protein n=1 Tax=Gracilibacillus xinjiangensis TaxID=1193282 RepID=A0ABV8WZR9_9BACI
MNYPFVSLQKVRIGEEMKTNPKQTKEKKPGIFQWLIVIIVPLIFAAIFALIILYFMGVDVVSYSKETLNKVPFLSETVMTDEEELHQQQLETKDDTISTKDEEISSLQTQLQEKDQQIEDLQEEVTSLADQLTEQQNELESSTATDESHKEITSSFENMKPKTAAPIIENLDNQLAVSILRQLDADVRGDILAQMKPETAAIYTEMLANQ